MSLPTPWDPEDLVAHLAVWAGVSGALVAVVVWVLAVIQAAKGWAGAANRVIGGIRGAQGWVADRTSERKRSAARMAVCSLFTVASAYMVAVIVNAVVQIAETDGVNTLSSPVAVGQAYPASVVARTAIVTDWPTAAVWTVVVGIGGIGLLGFACISGWDGMRKLITFLGGLACVAAWIAGAGLGVDSLIGFAVLGSQNPPPLSLLVTELITAVLCLLIGLLLPQVRKACGIAFISR